MAVQGSIRPQPRFVRGPLLLWAAVLLAASLSLAAALGGLLLGRGPSSSPARSAAEEAADSEARIAFFEQRAAADPLDFLSLNVLAGEYLQRGRETGDVAFYQRAEQAATRSLAILPAGNYAGTLLLASVRLVQHDYVSAEKLVRDGLALKPSGASGYGLLGDAQVGLGLYDDAYVSFAKMLDLEPGLPALSRMANLAYINGDKFNAIDYWKQAISRSDGLPLENQAWVHVQLGVTYFAYGDLKHAEAEQQRALDLYPDYVHALAGLGQVRAAQGRYAEAIDLYTRAVTRLPQPQYVATLGDVYAAAGDQANAQKQYALVGAIAQLYRANGIDTDLQIALFYADHDLNLDEALDTARRAYASAPSVYAADALSWALYKNLAYTEAEAMSRQALSRGTDDASFLFHAALISHATGDESSARDSLQRAIELNPNFSPLHSTAARQLLDELEQK